MSKPDYFSIAQQLKTETDLIIRQQLTEQLYTFNSTLTEEEKELFEYVEFDYFENNPSTVNDKFISAVGVYYRDDGVTSK
jgi:hypothetical protein